VTTRTAAAASAERYARHALVPGWDQESLSAASVVIVGVGAVGSEAARLLGQAGAGRLLLCDPDTVQESNLSRGALYGPDDLGLPKAAAAAAALRAREPRLAVTTRVTDLQHGIGLAELRAASLVLSCLDSVADRVALAGRCGLAGVGMLDAGTHPWGGEVRYFAPGGACFACGCTPAERALQTWHVACADPPEHAGASAPIAAMVAAWQCTLAVRLLFGLPVRAGAVRLDPVTGQGETVVLRRDPDCPCHAAIDPAKVTRAGLGTSAPAGELLALLAPDEQVLAWAPTTPGDPLGPLALRPADAGRTLASLGIPSGEILPVVRPPGTVRYLELETEPC
jgi:molybdopterin/thiamine biosynthesis adenylyltransferase